MARIDDFSRLVQTIYAAAVDPTNWAVALDGITTTLGATGCALLTTDRAHNEITVKSVDADPASMTATDRKAPTAPARPEATGAPAACDTAEDGLATLNNQPPPQRN